MTFHPSHFAGLVAEDSQAQARLFTQYLGRRDDFDVIVIGSGMGGGILADELTELAGNAKRILVLDAGSYLFPTHVYNVSRFDNGGVARSFSCRNFWQAGGFGDEHYLHEAPQLNLGGRSIFWSGLIPTAQAWELDFFPDAVRAALTPLALAAAGSKLNQSITLGTFAEQIVAELAQSPLADDFRIEQTPRAVHQPYLTDAGTPRASYFLEPTGVFNTAELLINQLDRDRDHDGPGLHLQIHQYVEDVQPLSGGWFRLASRTTTTGQARFYYAPKIVLAAGSIESPKLLARSTVGRGLNSDVRSRVGRALTDHPTTEDRAGFVTHCGPVEIPRDEHAKIILYSRGGRDQNGQIRFPFNVEVNINHQYWHVHQNDPDQVPQVGQEGDSVLDFKFSFANCLDPDNVIHPAAPFQYVPQIEFRNLNWTSHLEGRFARLAGWQKNPAEIFAVLNGVGDRLLSQFRRRGQPVQASSPLGQDGRGFGRGTVHHAVGSLHMPYRPSLDAPVSYESVVDENLQVLGAPGLFVCDMSVLPISTAANPVRSLAALALRLGQHLATLD